MKPHLDYRIAKYTPVMSPRGRFWIMVMNNGEQITVWMG